MVKMSFTNDGLDDVSDFTVFDNSFGDNRLGLVVLDDLVKTFLGEVQVLEPLLWLTFFVPGNLVQWDQFVSNTDSGTRVGRQVDSWNTQLSGQFSNLVEEVIFLWTEGTDLEGDIVGNNQELTASWVFWSLGKDLETNHTDVVGTSVSVNFSQIVVVVQDQFSGFGTHQVSLVTLWLQEFLFWVWSRDGSQVHGTWRVNGLEDPFTLRVLDFDVQLRLDDVTRDIVDLGSQWERNTEPTEGSLDIFWQDVEDSREVDEDVVQVGVGSVNDFQGVQDVRHQSVSFRGQVLLDGDVVTDTTSSDDTSDEESLVDRGVLTDGFVDVQVSVVGEDWLDVEVGQSGQFQLQALLRSSVVSSVGQSWQLELPFDNWSIVGGVVVQGPDNVVGSVSTANVNFSGSSGDIWVWVDQELGQDIKDNVLRVNDILQDIQLWLTVVGADFTVSGFNNRGLQDVFQLVGSFLDRRLLLTQWLVVLQDGQDQVVLGGDSGVRQDDGDHLGQVLLVFISQLQHDIFFSDVVTSEQSFDSVNKPSTSPEAAVFSINLVNCLAGKGASLEEDLSTKAIKSSSNLIGNLVCKAEICWFHSEYGKAGSLKTSIKDFKVAFMTTWLSQSGSTDFLLPVDSVRLTVKGNQQPTVGQLLDTDFDLGTVDEQSVDLIGRLGSSELVSVAFVDEFHWEDGLQGVLGWNLTLLQRGHEVLLGFLRRDVGLGDGTTDGGNGGVWSFGSQLLGDQFIQPTSGDGVVFEIGGFQQLDQVLDGGLEVTSDGQFLQSDNHVLSGGLSVFTEGEDVTKLRIRERVDVTLVGNGEVTPDVGGGSEVQFVDGTTRWLETFTWIFRGDTTGGTVALWSWSSLRSQSRFGLEAKVDFSGSVWIDTVEQSDVSDSVQWNTHGNLQLSSWQVDTSDHFGGWMLDFQLHDEDRRTWDFVGGLLVKSDKVLFVVNLSDTFTTTTFGGLDHDWEPNLSGLFPNSVNFGSFSNIDNQFNIGVVVVVGTTWDFDVLVSHTDVLRVGFQIFWGGHGDELDDSFVTKGFVGPLSDRSDFLDGGNTIVRDQNLSDDSVTAVLLHESLQRTFFGDVQSVQTNEVFWQCFMQRSVFL
ncbi:hypothetical protein WICPIJ_002577 [Wickerhamomyces pijperi]|uniref:Uncharacterized protein n=1 Tax=Wickerhamomyces pijperi TaxID=599730 RepID=A0A9P8Q989_WICPI|nr:hypothetical protein WICPIJ_002577 [Wickerhamomyces pijperi]